MNDTTDLLHVARIRECNVQPPRAPSATTHATTRATSSLKAAALLVIARNRACNNRATTPAPGVQQSPAQSAPLVASGSALTAPLAELNGLLARLLRRPGVSPAEVTEAQEVATHNVMEALRALRPLAEAMPEPALPISLVMDDRITCRQCTRRVGEVCRVKAGATALDQLRRCRSFEPRPEEQDQRSGRERWRWPNALD
jgi:hypothetical protein